MPEDNAKKLSPEQRAQIVNIVMNVVCLGCGLLILTSATLRIITNYVPGVGASGTWYQRMVPNPPDATMAAWGEVIHFWIVTALLLFFGVIIFVFTIWFAGFLKKLLGFYSIWFGRGVFFIVAGCLTLSTNYWDLVIAPIIVMVGLFFLILHCIPVVPVPRGFLTCCDGSED